MIRLAQDVTRLARLAAFWSVAPAFAYGIAFAAIIYSDAHLLWSLVLGGLVGWSWHNSVGACRTMYESGRYDGSSTAWAEAAEECDNRNSCCPHCVICGD